MQYSDYLKCIFCKADDLCAKYGIKYRAIESVYIAMLCECEVEYETNDPPIMCGNSMEYERKTLILKVLFFRIKHSGSLYEIVFG